MTISSMMTNYRTVWRLLALALVLFLALFNLTNYPTPWYDEGSHLHVPKTLVQIGLYADRSSEGVRYYGPTIGVGPTVLLPIAGMFKLFGIELWAARLVIAAYLVGTVVCFWGLARTMGGERLAWVATALLVASRGVALLEYGREVLGEVPGFFFVAAGLWVWFAKWDRVSWQRGAVVGILLGLAVVTKSQYFIILAPALALGWLANLVYYRAVSQRTFIIPGLIVGLMFAVWQVFVIVFLGPGTASDNLSMYREATASAATVFSPTLMAAGVRWLLSSSMYLGVLIPVLVYGVILAWPRQQAGLRWGVLILIIGVNLGWYVVASVGWVRYAFVGAALSALLVARFFSDLTDGFQVDWRELWSSWRTEAARWQVAAVRAALVAWCAAIVAVPLAQSLKDILLPPPNAPVAMAAYMNASVPREALVETWEPEMGFLTDHNYHYPPQVLLYRAVSYVWAHGPAPADEYTFVQDQKPPYILVGNFSRGTGLYPPAWLTDYTLMKQIGGYELYARNQ